VLGGVGVSGGGGGGDGDGNSDGCSEMCSWSWSLACDRYFSGCWSWVCGLPLSSVIVLVVVRIVAVRVIAAARLLMAECGGLAMKDWGAPPDRGTLDSPKWDRHIRVTSVMIDLIIDRSRL
jgi:hypothetical protein